MARPKAPEQPTFTATPAILSLPVEERAHLAVKDWEAGGYFKTRKEVARYYNVQPKLLYNRLKGIKSAHVVRRGNRLLTAEEELAVLSWINLHVAAGIQLTSLNIGRAATFLIESNNRRSEVCARWARRWMRRHSELCESSKTRSLAIMRKATVNVEDIQGYFTAYKEILAKEGLFPEIEWKPNETGSRVGVFLCRLWTWAYPGVDTAVPDKPEVRKLIAVVEAISNTSNPHQPLVILPVKHLAYKPPIIHVEDDDAQPEGPPEGPEKQFKDIPEDIPRTQRSKSI